MNANLPTAARTITPVEILPRNRAGYQISMLPGTDPDATAVIIPAGTDRTAAEDQMNAIADAHPDTAVFLDYEGAPIGFGELAGRIPFAGLDAYIPA